VVVPEDQLSLAIGRDGQNARLAAKLTGWRIDIKSLPEAATDTLYRLQKETELAELATQEAAMMHTVEDMLARKADGKALSPEEYDQMSRFVDRVERRLTSRPAEAKVDVDALEIARGQVPNSSFEISILDSGLPEHVAYILQEAGFSTVGEMAVQMKLDADVIFALNGVGPRAQQEIKALMDNLDAHAANEQEKRAAAEASAVVVEIVPAVEEVEEPAAAETAAVEEAPAEAEPAEVASESPAAAAEEVAEPASEEEEPAFDKLFELRPEIVDGAPFEEEEEESDDSSAAGKDKKKSKKKKKHTTVEYDPEKDQVIVKKKHKRGGDEWDWEL
jgi:N utilization substance protein A